MMAQENLEAVLNDLHCKYKLLQDGAVANYIPELASCESGVI